MSESKFVAVYKIHCVITNKDYIGISIDPEERVSAHANSSYPIGCAIRRYGWENFEVDILHLVETRREACKLEIEEIVKYNSFGSGGYNLTRGGDNPPRRCGEDNAMSNPKHRAKAIAGTRKYHEEHPGIWEGENASMYGKHHTEETKAKQRKAKLGKKQPNISKAMKGKNLGNKHAPKKNPAVSESNRRRKGEKRSGEALKNIQIGHLKRRLREVDNA